MEGNKGNISLGMTFRYITLSLILFIGGGFSLLLSTFLALPLMILAILLFTVKSGIAVESDTMRFRKYDLMLGNKIGRWHKLGKEDKVTLRQSRIDQNMNSRGTTVTTRVRTYDVVVHSGGKEKEVHEFTDYNKARKLYNMFTGGCGLEGRNLEEERQNKAR